MYFKINRDSPTGERVAELYARMKDYNNQAKALVIELGGQFTVSSSRTVAGGFSGIQFKEKPDGWKCVYEHYQGNFYFPKITKKNKLLLNRISALPVITRDEVNKLVAFHQQVVGLRLISSVGFIFGEDMYLLEVADEVDYTPNEDMVELTTSQYKALKAEIETKETPEPA